jgi:hypothetical protein
VTYPFHTTPKLDGYDHQDDQFTVSLAAGTDTDFTNNGGPIAVTWDSSADNQMKSAGDGDPIHGILLQVENRTVEGTLLGTVSLEFSDLLTPKAGLTGGQIVARGSYVCGAGNGKIRTAVSGTDASYSPYGPRCVEVRGTQAVIVHT